MQSTLLTVEEVAAALRVKPRTVYEWVKRGSVARSSLPGHLIRIPASEVVRLAAARQDKEAEA